MVVYITTSLPLKGRELCRLVILKVINGLKMKKVKPPKLSEHDIQTAIMELLTKAGVYHFRNNTGRKHNILFGVVGGSDLLGITNERCKVGKGRFLAIEVKNRTYQPSEAQLLFLETINRFGGVGILARSVEDVEKILK
jgi:hypothetical protein